MPFFDAVVPFADVFLYIPKGKYLTGLLNEAIHICAWRNDDVYIRA